MKRAIYVGKPWGDIRYGMTGEIVDISWSEAADKLCFIPDDDWFQVRYWADRPQLYIPSEDQKRHCPKP